MSFVFPFVCVCLFYLLSILIIYIFIRIGFDWDVFGKEVWLLHCCLKDCHGILVKIATIITSRGLLKRKKRVEKVDFVFEVPNGLVGMNRDVVLQLCFLMERKDPCIKAVFGMCSECACWRDHPCFVDFRKTFIRPFLCPNPKGGYVFVLKRDPNRGWKKNNTFQSVFLNTLIHNGIFRWTVQIAYAPWGEHSQMWYGCVLRDRDQYRNRYKARWRWRDECLPHLGECCCIQFSRHHIDRYKWRVDGSDGDFEVDDDAEDYFLMLQCCYRGREGRSGKGDEMAVNDGAFLSLEADMKLRTLSFFVNDTKLPCVISNLPMGLHFWGYAKHRAFFRTMSLRRLPAPTPSAVACLACEFSDGGQVSVFDR